MFTNLNLICISVGIFVLLFGGFICTKMSWFPLIIFWSVPVVKYWLAHHIPLFQSVDLTLLTVILIVSTVATSYFLGGLPPPLIDKLVISLHIALAFLMFMSLMWTPAPQYGLNKVLRFSVFSTIALIGPMVLLTTPQRVTTFGNALIVLGSAVALLIIIHPSYELQHGTAQWKLRQTALGANPLNPAFLMSVAGILCATGLTQYGKLYRTYCLVNFPLLLIAIYRTGSRAMFAQVFMGIAIWAIVRSSKLRWFYLSLLTCGLLLAPYWLNILTEGSNTQRIARLFENPVEVMTSLNRLPLWSYVLSHWYNRPIVGHGVGAFAVDVFQTDNRKFPHNLYLEALYEEGLIGLCLLLLFNFMIFYRYFKWFRFRHRIKNGNSIVHTWFSIALSSLIVVMVHFDLADIRLIWLTFGILVTVCRAEFKCLSKRRLS